MLITARSPALPSVQVNGKVLTRDNPPSVVMQKAEMQQQFSYHWMLPLRELTCRHLDVMFYLHVASKAA